MAVRVAQQARSAAFRRGRRERTGVTFEIAGPDPVIDDPELRQVLDEEINRLPWKYRAPIVLCYLEGQTHEEAARQLDWPLGTVKGRLARARAQLESRLARRGLAWAAALAALAAGTRSEAAFVGPLVEATCRAGVPPGQREAHRSHRFRIDRPARSRSLTTMMIQKLKLIALGAIVSGLFLTGAGVLARQQAGKPESAVETAEPRRNRTAPKVKVVVGRDSQARCRGADPAATASHKSPADLSRETGPGRPPCLPGDPGRLYLMGLGTAERVT